MKQRKKWMLGSIAAGCALLLVVGSAFAKKQKTEAPEKESEIESDAAITDSILGKTVPMTEEERNRMEADLQDVGEVCRAFALQTEFSRMDVDKMEQTLMDSGYCVVNSDALYPAYLENGELLKHFWENVCQGQNAEAAVWRINDDGSLYCRVFQSIDGTGYCMHLSACWEEGVLRRKYLEKKEILYWDLSDSGFLYQDIYAASHWDAVKLLRLQPVDPELYGWTEAYIAPMGYHNVNLFLLDWDSHDFGNMCFNDTFSGLYRMQYGDYFYPKNDDRTANLTYQYDIPAELFESVVFSHFQISLEDFREKALYDAGKDAYPWQDISCENVLFYSDVIPEVTKVTEQDDGTVTLLVSVICPDLHTEHLFSHEVTMKIEADGKFQYLSNRVTQRSDYELPSPQARIEAQRFDIGKRE